MNRSGPLVSIGMPVYNGEKYIHLAIDSLLAQTFTDFELIISDNASSDETRLICEEYARRDSRIFFVRQNENMGALANFQFVLNQAKGEFFMWAAADDCWDKLWIESIYRRICGEKCLAGFGELAHIDTHTTILRHPGNGSKLQFSGNRLQRKLAFFLSCEGCGKANLFYALYPRAALQLIEFEKYSFDYQILFLLLDQIQFVYIKGPRLFKRIHGECGGGGSQSVWRPPVILAHARFLWHYFQISTHYLQCSEPRLRVVLLLLIPAKLLGTLRYSLMRGALLLYKTLCSQ